MPEETQWQKMKVKAEVFTALFASVLSRKPQVLQGVAEEAGVV